MASARSENVVLSTCLPVLLWLLSLERGYAQGGIDEVQALTRFKSTCFDPNSTGPLDIVVSAYWDTWNETDKTPCAWVGVTCTANNSVEQLDLSGWGVNIVPNLTELAGLPDLRQLDLSSNNFYLDGTIPEEVGTLTRLTRLDLSRSKFVGGIPVHIADCRNLRYLSLEQNFLQGPISSLNSSLLNLQVLSLANNLFEGSFPKSLEGMSSLVSVDLSGNFFNGTIPSLKNLTNLLELNLDNNSFSSFEEPQVPIATTLKHLSVSGNKLEGPFPLGMTYIPKLEILNMSNNRLTGGIPSAWAIQLNHSFSLDLSQNLLTGKIPAALLQYNPQGEFVSLNLSYNNFTGNIDIAYGAPAYYAVLDLSHNQLSGPVPFSNQFSSIEYLWLQNNQLSGDIVDVLFPDGKVSAFSWSQELRLQNNLFTGDLSRMARNGSNFDISSVQVLDLSDNNLHMSTTDAVPDPLTSILEFLITSQLREFRLARNNFSGTSVPFGNISGFSGTNTQSLEILDISSNDLHGEISGTIFSEKYLPALQILNFSNNQVSGPLPESTLALPNLVFLNVSNNNMSGRLPYIQPSSSLYNPSLFAGNELCGNPLPPCPSMTSPLATNVKWWVYLVIISSVMIAVGSFLAATWRWRVYQKRHRQDADLIKTLMERESASLMSLRELKKATENFADSAKIGEGGFGKVYTGKLTDGTRVAIKRSKREGSGKDKQQFLNEVRILSQVRHRNLVKLLGCCMENKIALLVFEFVSNGTLQDHLRGNIGCGSTLLSWTQRLNIAVQTADALNYLHTAAIFPIYHRDVKSANILLDYQFNAKVADFGISKLAPVEATHVSTIAIQGTMGYIDPEYYTLYQLTGKSDVYSFGVVLLELISAKPVIDFHRGEDETSLVNFANPLIESGDLERLIDPALVKTYDDPCGRESMLNVGRLAMQCLDMRSRARPSMNEVSIELQSLWNKLGDNSKENFGAMDDDYSPDGSRDNVVLLSESFSEDSCYSFITQTDASVIQMSQFSDFDTTRTQS